MGNGMGWGKAGPRSTGQPSAQHLWLPEHPAFLEPSMLVSGCQTDCFQAMGYSVGHWGIGRTPSATR